MNYVSLYYQYLIYFVLTVMSYGYCVVNNQSVVVLSMITLVTHAYRCPIPLVNLCVS